jgi:hypothetical protein
MEVWAMRFNANINLSACMHFEVVWVVLLLFPTVRILASVFLLAAVCICRNKFLSLPHLTLVFLIIKDMRLSSEVLPVVSIDTNVPWMLCVAVWTPDGLKMEHIEVSI